MTTSKPLVSIVLTSYNKIDYIKEQIQSIYNQTYENWELIICDDLSTDGSIEYLQQLSINNKKIKCIFHEKNLGLCKNFESGLVECKGKYVAVCDADDAGVKLGKLCDQAVTTALGKDLGDMTTLQVLDFVKENFPRYFG